MAGQTTAAPKIAAQTASSTTAPSELALPAAEQTLKDFLGLNMVMGACESSVSPFLLRTVDDYAEAAGPKVQEMSREHRVIGRAELKFTRRDCAVMLPRALAKARLPGL
jgi:hypothetical protein